jgi:hypothetical protein
MKTARILAGAAVACALLAAIRTSPASAFFAIVNDPINGIKLLSQLTNQAAQIRNEVTQITNQGAQLTHDVRNLSKLPSLNVGNVTGEVNAVTSAATNVPGQVQGIAASATLFRNSLTDASRASNVNSTIGSADGAVQQQQLTNAQLGNIEGSIAQGNVAAAADRLQNFANTAETADAALTATGNAVNTSDKTPAL